jgi:hypothetical protein
VRGGSGLLTSRPLRRTRWVDAAAAAAAGTQAAGARGGGLVGGLRGPLCAKSLSTSILWMDHGYIESGRRGTM